MIRVKIKLRFFFLLSLMYFHSCGLFPQTEVKNSLEKGNDSLLSKIQGYWTCLYKYHPSLQLRNEVTGEEMRSFGSNLRIHNNVINVFDYTDEYHFSAVLGIDEKKRINYLGPSDFPEYYDITYIYLVGDTLILSSAAGYSSYPNEWREYYSRDTFKDSIVSNLVTNMVGAGDKKLQDVLADFTKFYKGVINEDEEIRMMLSKGGDYLTGQYKYLKKPRYLNLNGSIDSTGKISLMEWTDEGIPSGFTFVGEFKNNSLKGMRFKYERNPKLNFELVEYDGADFFDADVKSISSVKIETAISNRGIIYPVLKGSINPYIAKRINSINYPSDSCISGYNFYIYKNYFQVASRSECYKFSEHKKVIFDLRTGNPVKGLDIFLPEKRGQLLRYITRMLQRIYDQQNSGECMDGAARPEIIGWKNIEISIGNGGINFKYVYGYPLSCNAYENGLLLMKWDELKDFLADCNKPK